MTGILSFVLMINKTYLNVRNHYRYIYVEMMRQSRKAVLSDNAFYRCVLGLVSTGQKERQNCL